MATVQVNPAILRWARETAGLSPEEAAKQLDIGAARGLSGVERLQLFEHGQEQPTRPLLVRMSKRYRRPLLVFYLAEPPRKGARGEDFRKLPESYHGEEEPLIDALLRDVKARQSIVRAVLEDEDETAPVRFIGSVDMTIGVKRLADRIQETIAFDRAAYRAQSSVNDAFAYLRTRCEAAGVFVLLLGNLGSHHTAISTAAFRGFALADRIAPFIVINDQDAKVAWSFTLLHELTHLWLGQTGISGDFGARRVERFCNDVAARVLLADEELRALEVEGGRISVALAAERIAAFARERKLSRPMVAYRLFRAGRIDEPLWESLRSRFRRDWLQEREKERERAKDSEGGPSFYRIRRHRVGNALLSLVEGAVWSGALSTTKAAKVLGVNPRNVYNLLSYR